MSDMGDMWREIKEQSKAHRLIKQSEGYQVVIDWCISNDAQVQIISDYQFRIWKGGIKFDVYPQSNKWHRLSDNKRGKDKDLVTCLNVEFKI